MIRWAAIAVLAILSALPARAQAPPMGINMSHLRDWSSSQPFLDVMKTARRWIGHRPGQWGGMSYDELVAMGVLDDDGWPVRIPSELSSVGTVILTDLPEGADIYAGRYVLRFEGTGIVEVTGRATNKRYGKNEVSFDFTPGPGPVEIRIQRSDRRGTGDYVRNITVLREDRVALYDEGATFNPDWTGMLAGFEVLRFMNWTLTNESQASDWAARARATDFSYTRHGVPYEVMLKLSDLVGADPWFSIPHLADDGYVNGFCTLMRDRMSPDRKVYVEYSNEVWNWQFRQAEWAGEQAEARWGARDQSTQFYGLRAAQVARACREVFGPQAETRLVNVIATQTGWLGLEQGILNAPLWQEEAAGNAPPYQAFDAYAISGYFGTLGTESMMPQVRRWLTESREAAEAQAAAQGLSAAELEAYVATHRFDLAVTRAVEVLETGGEGSLSDLAGRVFPYHAGVARDYGLDLIMYEGGTHVVGLGSSVEDDEITAFFTYLNYTPEMGALYTRLVTDYRAAGGQLFNHYSDVLVPGKWGSWGAMRYLGDDNPRWRALEAFK